MIITGYDLNTKKAETPRKQRASAKLVDISYVKIKNATKFGTSWIGEYACKNVAESFDEAVSNFVNEVLTNHRIIRGLEN